jgi:hypothetical protein
MALLCIKARRGDNMKLNTSKLASEAVQCFPNSLEPLNRAATVLYDTETNCYYLCTRDENTGEYSWATLNGSRRGLYLRQRYNTER